MKKKSKFIYKLLAFLAVVLLLSIAVLIPPVGEQVSKITGIAADKIKYWAQTIVGGVVGALLLVVGVLTIEMPILGVPLVIAGLSIMGYTIWPLFSSNKSE